MLGDMPAKAHGMVGWRHAFGGAAPASAHAFASGGLPFTIAGASFARDAVLVEAGLSLALTPDARLGASYSGQFGPRSSVDHGVKASLDWRF